MLFSGIAITSIFVLKKMDQIMIVAQKPKNENERLENLRSYEILDTDSQKSFDAITKMASYLCGTPIALISLVDEHRQWFKSKIGVDINETPRNISFCAHAILDPENALIIDDASKDERFQDNPLVCAVPNLQFYAGHPIVTKEGFPIGTLCVLDYKPNMLNDKQKEMLQCLAEQTAELITLFKQNNELETLSMVVEKSSNMISIVDLKGRYEYANPMLLRKSGYKKTELIGKTPAELHLGKETNLDYVDQLWKAAANHQFMEQELCLYNKMGNPFWAKVSITPVFDDHGQLRKYIGILNDVTDFKKKEEDLIKAKDEAKESLKLKEQFLSNMSHEIRTPMNGIIGVSNILMEDDSLTSKQKEYLGHIHYSAESLLSILNDILDFSKINSDKLTFETINFDLPELFDHLKGGIGILAKEKGIDFKIHLDDKLPRFVSGDPTRFNQILRNLVGNAVKFTEIGGVDIHVSLLKYNASGPLVAVTITDTGIGIPAKRIDAIFDDFQQAHNYTTRKYGGTGLGMSIAKKLVERYGGKLSVKSKEGVGTECSFFIQLENPIIETLINNKNAARAPHQEHSHGFRILLVEDNIINQIVGKNSLEKIGYSVDVADDGLMGVDMFRKNRYDLILMDVQMPGLNGLDATRLIRSMGSDIPILAMTASVMDHDKVKCLEAGMNHTLPKPIKPETLEEELSKFLPVKA